MSFVQLLGLLVVVVDERDIELLTSVFTATKNIETQSRKTIFNASDGISKAILKATLNFHC